MSATLRCPDCTKPLREFKTIRGNSAGIQREFAQTKILILSHQEGVPVGQRLQTNPEHQPIIVFAGIILTVASKPLAMQQALKSWFCLGFWLRGHRKKWPSAKIRDIPNMKFFWNVATINMHHFLWSPGIFVTPPLNFLFCWVRCWLRLPWAIFQGRF